MALSTSSIPHPQTPGWVLLGSSGHRSVTVEVGSVTSISQAGIQKSPAAIHNGSVFFEQFMEALSILCARQVCLGNRLPKSPNASF